jgi:hypothetical protein
MSRNGAERLRRRGRVTGNIDGLILVGEKEVIRAVLVAEDASAVIEGVLGTNVLEANRAPIQMGLGFRLLAVLAGDRFRHGSLRGRGL